MNYNLTISVVLFETDEDEIKAIIEIIKASNLKTKLFFIDNSLTDTLKIYVPKEDGITYIHTGKNLGFGAGHNIAIKFAKTISEFHLILNADVDFNAEILETMYSYMKKHEDVGLLAPKILHPDGSIQYTAKLLPTPANLIVRRFIPIEYIKNKFDYNYELKFSDYTKIVNVPTFMGCFLFINCRVFNKISGFDEQFFMYSEDVDLTRRIHKQFKTLYFPEVTIYHKHGRGSYNNSKLLGYHIKSMIKYFNKWGWFFDKERVQINKKTLSQFIK